MVRQASQTILSESGESSLAVVTTSRCFLHIACPHRSQPPPPEPGLNASLQISQCQGISQPFILCSLEKSYGAKVDQLELDFPVAFCASVKGFDDALYFDGLLAGYQGVTIFTDAIDEFVVGTGDVAC